MVKFAPTLLVAALTFASSSSLAAPTPTTAPETADSAVESNDELATTKKDGQDDFESDQPLEKKSMIARGPNDTRGTLSSIIIPVQRTHESPFLSKPARAPADPPPNRSAVASLSLQLARTCTLVERPQSEATSSQASDSRARLPRSVWEA